MAYSRTWDDTAPPDGRNADEIGAAMRELRVDIHQRANTFFTDFDADPLVPIAAYSGAVADRILMISCFFFINNNISSVLPASTYLQIRQNNVGSSGFGCVPIIIPVGYKITEFAFIALTTTGDTCKGSLRYIDTTTGLTTNLTGDLTENGDGSTIKTTVSGVLAYTVVGTESFFANIELNNDSTTQLYGCRIKITKSNNSTGY